MTVGRAEQAAEAAEASLAVDPGDVDSHRALIEALMQLERLDEARAAAMRAIALRPAHVALRLQAAVVWLLLNQPGRAAAVVRDLNCSEGAGPISKADRLRRRVLAMSGDVEGAVDELAGPGRTERAVWLVRADLYRWGRAFEAAVDAYDRTLVAPGPVLPPQGVATVHLQRAELLIWLDRFDDATHALESAEEHGSPAEQERLRLMLSSQRGDFEGALAIARDLRTHESRMPSLRTFQAYIHVEAGQPERAVEALDSAREHLDRYRPPEHRSATADRFGRLVCAIESLAAVLHWHDGDSSSSLTHAGTALSAPMIRSLDLGQRWDQAVERALAKCMVGNQNAAAEVAAFRWNRAPTREYPGRFRLLDAPRGTPIGLGDLASVVLNEPLPSTSDVP